MDNRRNREKNLEILKSREDLILKMTKAVQNPGMLDKTSLEQFRLSYQELSAHKNTDIDNFKKFETAYNKNLNFLSKKISAEKNEHVKPGNKTENMKSTTVSEKPTLATSHSMWEKKTTHNNKNEKNAYEHKIIELGNRGGEDIIMAAPNNVIYQVKHITSSLTFAQLYNLLLEQFPDDFKGMSPLNMIHLQNDENVYAINETKLNHTNYSEGDLLQLGEKNKKFEKFNGSIADFIAKFTDPTKDPIIKRVDDMPMRPQRK